MTIRPSRRSRAIFLPPMLAAWRSSARRPYSKRPDKGTAGRVPPASAIAQVGPLEGELATLLRRNSRCRCPSSATSSIRAENRPLRASFSRAASVLLNLWATWVASPAGRDTGAGQIAKTLGSRDFEGWLSTSTPTVSKVQDFLGTLRSKLANYSDPRADVFYRLRLRRQGGKALPPPFIGRDGCEIAAMAGPAN